ncbi:MAG TPA: hypothetical protein VHH35_14880, partial [Pyrinomonadaceae bacterium]|nr:hypothetical protein [Pyrinomonadaceae bacterium]
SLSIVEYSIADAALSATDPYSLYQSQDELRRVCYYACVRKQSSRAGSVLILRYFYGYHISEVAEVLGGTTEAVRQSLRFARGEARLFLADPGALKFIDRAETAASIAQTKAVCAAEDLLAELRVTIFNSCQGDCFERDSLRDLYIRGLITSADNTTLAHIVSCPRCLDDANRELGLPLLSERHPADALGPNNNWRGGPGGGAANGGKRLRAVREKRAEAEKISESFLLQCRRRTREIFEHYPAELRVSVNGYLLGSQSVNSETSRLCLDITISEPLGFIEVLNEENARLLVMTVEPPPVGEPRQVRRIALSEGRHLEVTLQHGHPWPMLEVVYNDPGFVAQTSTAHIDRFWKDTPAIEDERSTAGQPYRGPRAAPIKVKDPAATRRVGGLLDLLRAIRLLSIPFSNGPQAVTAIVALLLIGVILFLRINVTPSINATDLLERAQAAEAAAAAPELAVHRVIDLEERVHGTGNVISRSRIEIWRDPHRRLSARRVYDEKGSLLIAELVRHHSGKSGDPSRMVYETGRAPRVESEVRNAHKALENFELWRFEPSASDYDEMIGQSRSARVSEERDVYVISYHNPQAGEAAIRQATLTLRKSDLHEISQTLVVQRAGELRDFYFAEARFERPSVSDVPPGIFEFGPEVSKVVTGVVTGTTPAAKREDSPVSSATTTASVVATPALEIEVAYLLDPFRLRFGDQVNLLRASDGALEVNAIVDHESTRQEMLRALSGVIDEPALRVRIETAAEALAREQGRQHGSVVVKEFTGSDLRIPVYPELHRYFSQRMSAFDSAGTESGSDRVDQAVRSFASRAVGHSRRAMSHAMELKQLSRRFSAKELDGLSPSARARWFSLVRSHVEALRRETSLLSEELRTVFFGGDGVAATTTEISSIADLSGAIERLGQLVMATDVGIRAAFAVSSEPGDQAVKSPQFRITLATTKRLAAAIQEFAANEY